MPKRRPLLFFALMIAMVALFAATDVLAQECNAPECFQAGDCQVRVVRGVDGEYPIVVEATGPSAYDVYRTACLHNPVENPVGLPCTVFAYEEKTGCSFSQMAQALPDPAKYCPDDQWDILWKSIPASWQPAGAGDTDTGWYAGDGSTRVLESQPNVDSWFFITTDNVAAHPAPVFMKHGKKDYFYSTLLSANCWVPPPPIANSGSCHTTDEGYTLCVEQTAGGVITTCTTPTGGTCTATANATDEVEICFPTDDTPACPSGQVEIETKCYNCESVKAGTNWSGTSGEDSTCWEYWNGWWYSYSC